MAYKCDICEKGPKAGFTVSHSRRHTKRRFLPNLQKIRVVLSGHVQRATVCTNCIKSGKIKKAA